MLHGVGVITTSIDTEEKFEEKLVQYLRSEEGREYITKLATE